LHRNGSTTSFFHLAIFARIVSDFYKSIRIASYRQGEGVFLESFLEICLMDSQGFDPADDAAGQTIARLQLMDSDFLPNAFCMMYYAIVNGRRTNIMMERVSNPTVTYRWWMSPARWMRWLPVLIDCAIWLGALSFVGLLVIRLLLRALSIFNRTFVFGGVFGATCMYLWQASAAPGAQRT
jgi:hypothetical protein